MPRKNWMLLVAVVLATPAWAHPDVATQLYELDRREVSADCAADTELQRGRLERERHEWEAAAAAYERARRCDPNSFDVLVGRAELALERGAPEDALALLPAQRSDPVESSRVSWLRGRARLELGQVAAAAHDFSVAMQLHPYERPDDYLLYARSLLEGGEVEGSLAAIELAIDRLGPAPAFEEMALNLEMRLGRHAAALQRLGELIASTSGAEGWLLRRAEILEESGRREEALAGYEATLDRVLQRTPAKRATAALRDLAERARAGYGRLTQSCPTSSS